MRTTNLLLTFLFSWVIIFSSQAQFVDNDETSYKRLCKFLNTEKVTTGLLSNQTWPLSTIPVLKGAVQDTIDATLFKQLFFDLHNARVEGSDFPSIDHLRKQLRVNTIYKIPLGIIYQNYNYIKANAIEDSLLLFENDRFWDGPNKSESPYEIGQTFAAAALKSGSHFTLGKPITFELSDSLIFNDSGKSIIRYEVDFCNGSGYQEIFPNEEVSIYYDGAGKRILHFKVYTTTDTLYSHSKIDLHETHGNSTGGNTILSSSGGGGVCPPDHIESFSTPALQLWCPGFASWTAHANAYVRYANPDNPQLTQPIIFVEGLDLGTEITQVRTDVPGEHATIRNGDFGWDVFTTGVNPDKPNPGFANLPNLLSAFSDDEYDIILLDFEQGAASIQQNAALLTQLIEWVNEEKIGCEQNVVIGASMGGQVARYALASMEVAGEDHDTRLYASIDSPHQGANIHPGLQGAIKFFSPLLEDANLAFNSLQLPAVKQQLLYHISEEECFREKYVAELAGLGYPGRCRNVAVVSGSNAGSEGGQGFNAGDKLLDFNLQVIGLGLLQGFMDVDLDIWALQNESFGNNQKVFEVDADGFFSMFPLPVSISVNVHDELSVDPSSLGPLDSAPGGNRSTIGDEIAPGLQLSFLTSLPGLLVQGLTGIFVPSNLDVEENHSFIPSISALDVNTDNLYFDIATNIDPDDALTLTPFDAYFSQPENLGHVEISPAVIDWVAAIELPRSRPNLPDPLNETYNYGLIIDKIAEVTILESGILRINDMGPTGLLNEGASRDELFKVYTQGNCGGNITVENEGQFILGSDTGDEVFRRGEVYITGGSALNINGGGTVLLNQRSRLILENNAEAIIEDGGLLNATFGAKVIVESGGKLQVTSGGRLRIMHWSDLIVEEGGQLIIDDGAIIQLWDGQAPDGEANIQVRGELVINGEFEFSGSGFFTFFDTHELTFGPDAQGLTLDGYGKGSRMIRLEDADLEIGGHELHLSNGEIEYTGASSIIVDEGGSVVFDALELRSISNSIFTEGTGLKTFDASNVEISDCDFFNLNWGIAASGFGNSAGFHRVSHSSFTDCSNGIWVIGLNQFISFDNRYNGAANSLTAILAYEVGDIFSWGDLINGYPESNYLDQNGAVVLSDVSSFRMQQGVISNNGVGIVTSEGFRSNIFLSRGTRVQNNGIGVYTVKGGVDNDGTDYGLVHADCAKFIDNSIAAIKGTDVLLEIDAYENCLNCPHSELRHNVFTGDLLFDICYQDRDVTEVSARGNYWGGDPDAPSLSQYGIRHDDVGNGCGFIWSNIDLDASNPELSEPTGNCIGGGKPGKDPYDPEDKACVLSIEKTTYLLHEQYRQAYEDFYNDDLDKSSLKFTPLAGISDGVRTKASSVCKQYIDVARVMTHLKTPETNKSHKSGGLRSYAAEYDDLWVDGAIIKNRLKDNVTIFDVYPNPAVDRLILDLDHRDQEIRFINSLGEIQYAGKASGKTIIKVAEWPNGLYLIESIDIGTKQRQIGKVVIQH